MGKATQDLRKEHDAVLHALNIYENIIFSDSREENVLLKYYSELVYFLQAFADKCHHGKEEKYLFKELTLKGGVIESGFVDLLLAEHKEARDYVSAMEKALESKDLGALNSWATKYSDLLRRHIEEENNGIFLMADELLSEDEQDTLFEKFEDHEETVIGHGVHEELHSMIHGWEEL